MQKRIAIFFFLQIILLFGFSFFLPHNVFAVEKGICKVTYFNTGNSVNCCLWNGTPNNGTWTVQPNPGDKNLWCGLPLRSNEETSWPCYCEQIKKTVNSAADNGAGQGASTSKTTFTPSVTIPGNNVFFANNSVTVPASTQLLADYIIAIFKYATGVVGIIATIVIMFGGVRWLTAGGGPAVSEAKSMIIGGLSGLLLTLGSFLMLSTISTSLVNFKIQPITQITKIDLFQIGCCMKVAQDGTVTTENLKDVDCQALKGYKNVSFEFGQVANANKCELDPKKQACCLYNFDKNNNLATACMSKNMGSIDAVDIFRNACTTEANKADVSKYIKGKIDLQEGQTCDDHGTDLRSCVDPN